MSLDLEAARASYERFARSEADDPAYHAYATVAYVPALIAEVERCWAIESVVLPTLEDAERNAATDAEWARQARAALEAARFVKDSHPPQKDQRKLTITFEISENGCGVLQLSINNLGENGAGYGYRILGPKFDGSGVPLAVHVLTERDAHEIGKYLQQVRGDESRSHPPTEQNGD